MKSLFCNLLCGILICSQILMGSQFCQAKDMSGCQEYLSPKISISEDSLKNCLEFYSKARIEEALRKTAKTVTDIAIRNFEREFNPQELVIVLAMLLEGKSLREIDDRLALGNYVMEEMGAKKPQKKPKRVRLLRSASTLFFAAGFGYVYVFLDIVGWMVNHVLFLPLFLGAIWLIVGWITDFFFWIEKKIDPRNKYVFEDPAEDLSAQERAEFLKHLKNTISNVIANRFDEGKSKDHKAYDPESRQMDLDLPVVIDPIRVFRYDIMMSAI